jgi:hypothetical protein
VWLFGTFFNGFEHSIKYGIHDTKYKIFEKLIFLFNYILFANLKPKYNETAQKNLKHIFWMCLRIPFYIYLKSGRLHFFKKCKNRCTLLCMLGWMWLHGCMAIQMAEVCYIYTVYLVLLHTKEYRNALTQEFINSFRFILKSVSWVHTAGLYSREISGPTGGPSPESAGTAGPASHWLAESQARPHWLPLFTSASVFASGLLYRVILIERPT